MVLYVRTVCMCIYIYLYIYILRNVAIGTYTISYCQMGIVLQNTCELFCLPPLLIGHEM